MPKVRYDKPKSGCAGGATAGAIALQDRILGLWPQAKPGGIYVCRNVRGGSGNSLHSEGRAVDIMISDKRVGDLIAQWCQQNAAIYQIQEIIWWRRIWSSTKAVSGFRKYSGQSPHTDHVHIGLNRIGASAEWAAKTPPIREVVRGNVMLAHVEFL